MSTTSAERPNTRKARAAETRRRLVQAAVDQFSERHYDDVAVSDIAESAGVAHGLLFHYFDSKRGIYLEAMHEAARELDFVDTVPPDLPAGRQFRQYLESHVGYLARHRGLALRLVRGGRGSSDHRQRCTRRSGLPELDRRPRRERKLSQHHADHARRCY